nr:putative aminopeptidase-2 [Osmia lignaria]
MNFIQDWASITVLLLVVAGFQLTKGNQEPFVEDGENITFYDYRLPKSVIPISYEINLIPTMGGDFIFIGSMSINAIVQQLTDTVTLHRGSVNITTLTVNWNNQTINKTPSRYNDTTEKYEISLNRTLNKGEKISINIAYNGKLRDDMIGFYKSSYIDSNGKIRWMATTQFQTAHARHAFPCFDEPSFKARFTIRILRPPGYNSLSNMPLHKSYKEPQGTWDEFQQSIPMSTYLVAFIISDFESLQLGNLSIWARPNAIRQAMYARDLSLDATIYLSRLFKQDFNIPKMDMVAIPDFSAGAMENWGIITYREMRLLCDSSTSDYANQSVATVIVHELTHEWFGNMITPEWWSYLWLSEAFARYFQYFGTAQIEKTWNLEEQFVVEQHQTAYASDGVESSQPMSREVSNTQQLSSIGDTITYNKGGSIVRMMNLIFGSDVFEASLQNYLSNNKETKVARPENLWEEFQKEINKRNQSLNATVREIMSTWTEKAGYPVLNIAINREGVASLQQRRFFLRNLKSTPTNLTWWVPLSWTTKENPNFNVVKPRYWLNKERDTINVGNSSGWVIFNVQSSGFYRVNYDYASWYRIFETLNSKNYADIHVLNRAVLVDDSLNLARAGMLSYNITFDCLQYLKFETNYLPFKSAFSGLSYLDQRLSGHAEYYKQFKKFVLVLIEIRYKELGYLDRPNDDRLTVLLRGELNKWACNYGHQGCIQTFTNMFQQWRKNNTSTIKPNQRSVAYCMGVKYGSKDDWEFLWNQYFNSNSANDQITLLQALGCSNNSTILEIYLLSALKSFEETRIRKQDCTSVFSAVYGSGIGGAEFVLNFVDKYHAQMKEYNGLGLVSSVLSSASQRFSTKQLVDKFDNLIQRRKVEFESIQTSLQNALEIAKYELWWFEKNIDPIISWIDSHDKENPPPIDSEYRLPQNLSPSKYYIDVKTDVNQADNFTFDGTVRIDTVVKQKTKTIVLHSSDLSHDNVNVLVGDKSVAVLSFTVDKKYDFLTIEVAQELQVGQNVTIVVGFKGSLNEDMRGFYRSWYFDLYGKVRWLAATHMEPVGARKMFPCFDEPAMKAKFVVNVTVPGDYSAISNMPIEHTVDHGNGRRSLLFKETPIMSTYLVALVVSDFKVLRNTNGKYAVWTNPMAIKYANYSLSVMEPLVSYYEKALSIPYQLPKLDMVALPDFVSGAMENWGLLTYKERYLLEGDESTTDSKQSIIDVISHEITHQWFGDYVSPLWWKYLWLNEGFARYFQYHGTASVKKDWSLEAQFVVEQLHSALETDSLASTHPMTHDVYSPTQIRGIFDTISYAKAASVIRMLEKSLGNDVFFKALHNYLEKRKYDVATPTDLADAFKDQITDPVVKNEIHSIMNSWTNQSGYPVIHVTVQPDYVILRQERFILKPGKDKVSAAKWYTPISWTSLNTLNFNDTKPRYWLQNTTDSLPNKNDLILLNLQQSGFYRTNYDNQTWKRIINVLKSDQREKIHEINRASLIDDLMNLGRAEMVDYDIVFSATQYLTQETDYIPWRAFFNNFNYLHKHMQERDAYGAFKRYASSLLLPIYNKLGFEDKETDSHVTKLFRSHVRKWACKLNISNCEEEAWSYWRFNPSSNKYASIQANYYSVVYCTVARRNSFSDWDLLMDLYKITSFPAHKLTLLQSLACTTDKVLLDQLLHQAITKDYVIRFEDSSSVFSYVMDASPEGVETVIEFVKNNYEKMVKYFRQESSVRSIVSAIGKKVFTQKLYNKYTNLLEWLSVKDPTSQNTLNSYKNDPDYELKWAERHIPMLHEWFETKYSHEDYRLPSTFSPLKYNISLSPGFEERNFTFTGRVKIEIERKRDDVSRIVVNAYKLYIKDVSVYQNPSEPLQVSSWLLNPNTQTLSIFMKNFIKSDKLFVDITYTGNLNDDMEGFYRSHYVNSKKQLRWLATTQFEPTYARQAFPCFDEPAMKAKFVIEMERPTDYVALSNMPLSSTRPSNNTGRVWDTFKETLNMSSYLIAFVVCDFQKLRTSLQSTNVWGRPEIVAKGELAEIVAPRILQYLFEETEHLFTFPKLDLIGIPDFQMGAMENWGLVTFREYGLFYEKDVTTAKYTDYIITIIAHELAHSMFGNLVTCDWWEYIWLNEGFAEYMQWRLSDMYQPQYNYQHLVVVNDLQPALLNDASSSTHPMNNPVSKPSEIKKVFDTVTYGKSSSVIRMIQKTFGQEVFKNVISNYLTRHRYSTATPKDLWKHFTREVNKTGGLGEWNITFESLMDGWTNKPGYPIVLAEYNFPTLKLTQKHYSTYKRSGDFWIPITMTDSYTPDFMKTSTNLWLGEDILRLNLKRDVDWFIINIQQSGYYRVNYDTDSWLRLIKALMEPTHSGIHFTNRAQIVDDAFNLARDGHLTYNITIGTTVYLVKEKNYLPWKAFFNALNFIVQRYEGRIGSDLLRDYVLALTTNRYKDLGFLDSYTEPHLNQLNRELILTWTCKYGNKDCVTQSTSLFREWRKDVKNKNGISPNARAAVYCTALKSGSDTEWNFLWEQYLKTDLATEKMVMLNAFGCTDNKILLNKYIQYMLDRTYPSKIRKQDISAAFASIYNAGQHGVDAILDFVMNDYEKLYEYYGNWDGVADLISKVASRVSTSSQILKLNTFAETKVGNITNLLPAVQSAIKTAKKNEDWYLTNSPVINRLLKHAITAIHKHNSSAAVTIQPLLILFTTVCTIFVYILSN